MRHLTRHILTATACLLATSVAAQNQLANYRFAGDFTSSDSDSDTIAGDVSATRNTMFYQGNLCLTDDWNTGGSLQWTITPNNGLTIGYTEVTYYVASITQDPVSVSEVTLFFDGAQVGAPISIDPDPAGTSVSWTLSELSANPADFELQFEGRPGGDEAYEIAYLRVYGAPETNNPMVDPHITPISRCATTCFDVTGDNLNNIHQVKIDGADITQTSWTYQVNSNSQMDVCPPAGIHPGRFHLTVIGSGGYRSTTTLQIDPGPPNIANVLNPSLLTVTQDCFRLEGCGFSDVTSVCFGSHTFSSQDPCDFGAGYFTILDDEHIEVCHPQCLLGGSYDIKLVTANGDSNLVSVTLSDPTVPTLACAPTHEVGCPQSIYLHSGGNPGLLFTIISSSTAPTVIPGIVNLQLGNQATDYICGVGRQGPCAEDHFGAIPTNLAGMNLYFQGVLFDYVNPTFPLATTNRCSTSYTQRIDIGDVGGGAVAQDDATGTGYLLYSAQDVDTRFGSNWLWPVAADNFVVVRETSPGVWEWDNNSDYFPFTPDPSDLIVAELDFDADTATLFTGQSLTIGGIDAGFDTSDLSIVPNVWNGSPNQGEFWIQGSFVTR